MTLTMAEAGLAGFLVAALLAAAASVVRRLRGAPEITLTSFACAVLAILYAALSPSFGLRQAVLVTLVVLWAAGLLVEFGRVQKVDGIKSRPWFVRGAMSFFGASPILVCCFDRLPVFASSYSATATVLIVIGAALRLVAWRWRDRRLAYMGNLAALYAFFVLACETPSGWLTLLGPLLLQYDIKQAYLSCGAKLRYADVPNRTGAPAIG